MSHPSNASLTGRQHELLQFFIVEGEGMGPGSWVEYFSSEARSVHALAQKGFVKLVSDAEFALSPKGFAYLFENASKLVSGRLPIYHLVKGALAFLDESVRQRAQAPEDEHAHGVCEQLQAIREQVNALTIQETLTQAAPPPGGRYAFALDLIQDMTDMIAQVDLPDQEGKEICGKLIELDAKVREREGVIDADRAGNRHRSLMANMRPGVC